MTRLSGDEIRHGRVWNGFDYELQVWVVDGIIQNCGHPATMRHQDRPCCNAHRLAGQKILDKESFFSDRSKGSQMQDAGELTSGGVRR